MKNVVLYILFVFSIVALFGFAFSFSQTAEISGKDIFVASKCGTCHSVTSQGLSSKKKDAVDLSNAGVNLKAEQISKFLKKEEKIKDNLHKIVFKGTEEELTTLANWLESLKK